MPIDSQAKLDADIRLIDAQTDKIRAEIAVMNVENDEKVGKSIVGKIKIFAAIVSALLSLIGVFAGYKIAEERVKIAEDKKNFFEVKNKDLEVKNKDLEVKNKKLDNDINNKQKELKRIDEDIAVKQASQQNVAPILDRLKKNLEESYDQLPDTLKLAINKDIPSLQLKARAAVSEPPKESTYYVIAVTSADIGDIEKERNKVKSKMKEANKKFDEEFPNIEIYQPPDDLFTLILNGKGLNKGKGESLSYVDAEKLQKKAVEAGFKDTWLWQSDAEYFHPKGN